MNNPVDNFLKEELGFRDVNDERVPFLKVNVKVEKYFEEGEEESKIKIEECESFVEVNVKEEHVSEEEESETEVDLGSFSSSEIVKQDPDAEQSFREGKEPLAVVSEKLQFECDICKKTFRLLFLLVAHKRIHAKETSFECDVCKKTFPKMSHLEVHSYMHLEEEAEEDEEEERATDGALFPCDACEQTFPQPSLLRLHAKRVHSGSCKPVECSVCKMKFAGRSHLLVHSRIHSDEKPYQCERCNSGFTESTALKNHIRIHTGEKPYECDVCQRRFTLLSGLKRHFPVHDRQKSKKKWFQGP